MYSRFYPIPFACLICLLVGFSACSFSEEKFEKISETEYWLPLIKLEESFISRHSQRVQIPYDPAYKQHNKHYQGIPLREVLDYYLDIENFPISRTRLFFQCKDGYQVSMPLTQALQYQAFLAVSDEDAPPADKWLPIPKSDGIPHSANPYYLVWKDAPRGDMSFVWPYGLLRVRVVIES